MRKVKNQTLTVKNSIKAKSKPSIAILKGHKRSKSDRPSEHLRQAKQQNKHFTIEIDEDVLFTFSNDPEVKQKMKIKRVQEPLQTPRIGSLNSIQLYTSQREKNVEKIYPHQKYKERVKQEQRNSKGCNLLGHYNKILSIAKKFEAQQGANKPSSVDQTNEKTIQKPTQSVFREQLYPQQDDFPDSLKCQDQDFKSLRLRRTPILSAREGHQFGKDLNKDKQNTKSYEQKQKKSCIDQKTDSSCENKSNHDQKTVKRAFNFTNIRINAIISDFGSIQLQQTAESKLVTKIKRRMLYDPETRPFIEPFKLKSGTEDTLNKRRRKMRSNF